MNRLELTDDSLTGIKEIDNQHRQFLDQGNKILFPEAVRLRGEDILDGLKFLIRYVDEHFSTEKRLKNILGIKDRMSIEVAPKAAPGG